MDIKFDADNIKRDYKSFRMDSLFDVLLNELINRYQSNKQLNEFLKVNNTKKYKNDKVFEQTEKQIADNIVIINFISTVLMS